MDRRDFCGRWSGGSDWENFFRARVTKGKTRNL